MFNVFVEVTVIVVEEGGGTDVCVTVIDEMLVVVDVLIEVEVTVEVVVDVAVSVLVTVEVRVEVTDDVNVVVYKGSRTTAASTHIADEPSVAGKSVVDETPLTIDCAAP